MWWWSVLVVLAICGICSNRSVLGCWSVVVWCWLVVIGAFNGGLGIEWR